MLKDKIKREMALHGISKSPILENGCFHSVFNNVHFALSLRNQPYNKISAEKSKVHSFAKSGCIYAILGLLPNNNFKLVIRTYKHKYIIHIFFL